jgi:hypothetical protein
VRSWSSHCVHRRRIDAQINSGGQCPPHDRNAAGRALPAIGRDGGFGQGRTAAPVFIDSAAASASASAATPSA